MHLTGKNQGALKQTSTMKWVKTIIQQNSFVQNEIVNSPHPILVANLSPVTLIKLFLFFTTVLVVFFFQFEACIIYCFDVEFVFNFVLDVLIVVYKSRIHLSEVKVNIFLLFFVNQLLLCNWINRFYFVNNVVDHKAILV